MTQVRAICDNGVFVPLTPIAIADKQKGILEIQTSEVEDWDTWLRETDEFQKRVFGDRLVPDSTPFIAADRMRWASSQRDS
jgi:hypothetical protein